MDRPPARDRAQIGIGAAALACGVCVALGAGGVLFLRPCSEAEVGRQVQILVDAQLEGVDRKWREAQEEATPYLEAAQEAAGGARRERLVSEVQACLPCDRWPEGYTPQGGGLLSGGLLGVGMATYIVAWPDDSSAVALVSRVPGRRELTGQLDPDGLGNKLGNSDLSAGEMEVQGRTVKTLSFRAFDDQPHLRIDITGEKEPCAILEILRPGSLPELEQTVVRFLEPFDLWRGE